MNEELLTNEDKKILQSFIEEDNLVGCINALDNAEEALQEAAWSEGGNRDYLYRYAYELKQLRRQLTAIMRTVYKDKGKEAEDALRR